MQSEEWPFWIDGKKDRANVHACEQQVYKRGTCWKVCEDKIAFFNAKFVELEKFMFQVFPISFLYEVSDIFPALTWDHNVQKRFPAQILEDRLLVE